MNPEYHKVIVLCEGEIRDYFTYRDQFQLYPLAYERNILKGENVNHFPLVLEYKIDYGEYKPLKSKYFVDKEDEIVKTMLKANYITDILKTLTAVTREYFFVYEYEKAWFSVLDKNNEESDSEWGLKKYSQVVSQMSGFTKLDIPGRTRFELGYVGHGFGDSYSLQFALDQIYNLNKDILDVVKRSITLMYQARKLPSDMNSLALVAYISSIETMVDLENQINDVKVERCNECKNLKFLATKKFKDYINKYYFFSTPEFTKTLNKLYDLRSKIVHTGQLLLGEVFFDWSEEAKIDEQKRLLRDAEDIAKWTLSNWAMMNQNSKLPTNSK